MNSFQLHERALSIAKDLKKNYIELFEVLLIMDRDQVFLGFDVTSLYTYCVEVLELSPSISKDLITVVNKSIEVPALAEAIRSGRTSISKARKICSVLTKDSTDEWIALATECSARVVEKAVAMANPRVAVRESMKYVGVDTLEFKLAVSEDWEALLRQTKDLLSQKQNRAVSSEEALFQLMQKFCEKENPVQKAERALDRPTKAMRETNRRTRYRSARVEHEVNLRDGGQCVHVHADGSRCEAKRWLQKHHVTEFANGGEHSVENLVTLCGAHHRARHQFSFVT
jgi:hypothetical protein